MDYGIASQPSRKQTSSLSMQRWNLFTSWLSQKPGSLQITLLLQLYCMQATPSHTPPGPLVCSFLSWKFSVFPTLTPTPTSFEFHAVAVSHPSKLYILVLCCPPGPLGCFLDELDTLLSSLPEDGTPVILLGDFNVPPESHQSSSVTSLLQSFAHPHPVPIPSHSQGW